MREQGMADEPVKPEVKDETPAEAAAAMAASQSAARAGDVAAAAEAAAPRHTDSLRGVAPPAAEGRSGGSWWRWLFVGLLVAIAVGGWLTREAWLPRLADVMGQDRQPTAAQTQPATPAPPSSTAATTPTGPAPATPGAPIAAAPAPAAPAAATDTLAQEQKQLAAEVDSVDRRLAGLEQAVAEVRKSVDSLVAAGEDTKSLTGAVNALEERIARLERSAIQTGALESQVRELSQKALTLREGFASLNTAVLAVSQLGQAVGSGAPYVRELAAVRSVAGNDPEMAEAIARLEPHAATGVPTTAALAARFPMVADAIARAAPTTGGDTWIDRVADKFASLVSIRATGPAAARAGGIDAVLAEAEAELKAGDLASAVAVVSRIEGQAAVPAEEWLKGAETRLEADRAVAALEAEAAARLAKARG